MSKTQKMITLTQSVRGAFNRLKLMSDALHADTAITTAMRAVMESLQAEGTQTVPQIARSKGVTRQHIQLLADSLCSEGLAAFQDNPAHKRSQLLALTDRGRKAFSKMAAREVPLIEELASTFDAKDIETAISVLQRLSEFVDARMPDSDS